MIIGLDISVLNDPNRTGIGVYTHELIKALLEIDREDQFILFGIATLSSYDYLKSLDLTKYQNVETKIYKWPAKFFRRSFLLWQRLEWPKIEQFIGSVDIFHSFNWYFPPQSSGKRVATVFDMTSVSHPEWHQGNTSQLDELRFERISKKADFVIAISESAKEDFLKFSPESKVEVVYPGVGKNFTDKGNSRDQEILGKYGIKPGFLLSVATLEPRKNLEGLIKAYSAQQLASCLVLVGGAGWRSEELRKLTQENPNIVLTGFVPEEDLPALYREADCFVYPSFYEGFGIPVLEALKSGTPVVCSNTSSLPEVGGDAVIYVDPYSLESIRHGLEGIKNKELRIKLKNQGLKQAEKFSWEKSAQKLFSLYRG